MSNFLSLYVMIFLTKTRREERKIIPHKNRRHYALFIWMEWYEGNKPNFSPAPFFVSFYTRDFYQAIAAAFDSISIQRSL